MFIVSMFSLVEPGNEHDDCVVFLGSTNIGQCCGLPTQSVAVSTYRELVSFVMLVSVPGLVVVSRQCVDEGKERKVRIDVLLL